MCISLLASQIAQCTQTRPDDAHVLVINSRSRSRSINRFIERVHRAMTPQRQCSKPNRDDEKISRKQTKLEKDMIGKKIHGSCSNIGRITKFFTPKKKRPSDL